MLLYDIFYPEGCDMSAPLPRKPDGDELFAVCVNGERRWYIPRNGEWVEVTRATALERA